MQYWLMNLTDIFVKDDFFVALMTTMLLLSCVCIVTLVVKNEFRERQLRRHGHVGRS